jgi:hypothetical protein
MDSAKYIGMDVHKESISIAVMNRGGKIVMESVIETKASTILQFIGGLCGDLRITFEEGTWASWLYDLANGALHSFFWQKGVIADLGTLGGPDSFVPVATTQ